MRQAAAHPWASPQLERGAAGRGAKLVTGCGSAGIFGLKAAPVLVLRYVFRGVALFERPKTNTEIARLRD